MVCQDSNSLKHHQPDFPMSTSAKITSVKYWKTESLSNCLNFCCYHNQANCPKGSIFKAWNLSLHNWWQCVHHHLFDGIGQFNPFHPNKHFQHSVPKVITFISVAKMVSTFYRRASFLLGIIPLKKKKIKNQCEWWKIKAFSELKHQPYKTFVIQIFPGWKGPGCHWLWNMDYFF